MHYKLFSYEILSGMRRTIGPDNHLQIFESSKWKDSTGQFSEYRGKKDAVLMHIRNYDYNFIGLVGRHSTQRAVDQYDEHKDEIFTDHIEDDDYPHVPFVCMPRIGMIACVDGRSVKPIAAMNRLHRIIGARTGYDFIFRTVSESFDLRKAIKTFKVTEVDFEIFPVNPHSGDLGLALDRSKKLDHVKKLKGKAEAPKGDPMRLEGGIITAIQQLQASGHCRVGFKGWSDHGIEVHVPKPSEPSTLKADDIDDESRSDVRLNFPDLKSSYPFTKDHVLRLHAVAKLFSQHDR